MRMASNKEGRIRGDRSEKHFSKGKDKESPLRRERTEAKNKGKCSAKKDGKQGEERTKLEDSQQ